MSIDYLKGFTKTFLHASKSLEEIKASDESLLQQLRTNELASAMLLKQREWIESEFKKVDLQRSIPKHSSLKDERKEKVLKTIRDLAPQWDLDPKSIFLRIRDELYFDAYSTQLTEKGGIIYLSPFFLVDASDLNEFKMDGVNDTKLFDDQFLEKAKSHIESIFEIKKSNSLTFISKQQLRLFLLLMQNPEKLEEAKQFIFGHELEHLRLRHAYKEIDRGHRKEQIIAFSASTALLAYLFVSKKSAPRSLFWAATAGLASKWALNFLNERKWTFSEETEADKGSKMKSRNAQGFKYFLSTAMELNKVSRSTSWLSSLIYTSDGDSWLNTIINYPSYKERLRNIEAEETNVN